MIKNGRWRGSMPFRRDKNTRPETLEQQGRTGEPSPAPSIQSQGRRDIWGEPLPKGYGMAEGSFTEKLRLALIEWVKNKYGSIYAPITFQYRLSRKKIITVTGNHPFIVHYKDLGRGSKGFFLRVRIISIEGVPPAGFVKYQNLFACNRIIGHETMQLLALPEPSEQD